MISKSFYESLEAISAERSLEIDKIVDDKEKKVFAIFDKKKKEIKEKKKQTKLLNE